MWNDSKNRGRAGSEGTQYKELASQESDKFLGVCVCVCFVNGRNNNVLDAGRKDLVTS